MSARTVIPHCAWAMKACRERKLPPDLSWLIVSIAERVDRNTLQWWSSVAAMVADTRFSRRKIQYLIRELPPDLISMRRGVNNRWVFTLLRPTVETPDAEAAELLGGAQCAPPDPQRGAQCAPYPLKKESPEGKEESAAPAAPPAPAPLRDEKLALKEAEAPRPKRPQRTPLPDDWTPSREERQLCIEANLDPKEFEADIRDWAQETGAQSADWGATARRWIRREPKFRAKGSRRGRPTGDDIKAVMAKYRAPSAFTGATIEGVAL